MTQLRQTLASIYAEPNTFYPKDSTFTKTEFVKGGPDPTVCVCTYALMYMFPFLYTARSQWEAFGT